MRTLGICFGATSLQCVILQSDPEIRVPIDIKRIRHEGNPPKAFFKYLEQVNPFEIDRIAVTGRHFKNIINLSSISEPEAVEIALSTVISSPPYPEFIISSGGETQIVYKIGINGEIMNTLSGNKCASGTGEFFLQQITRMGLDLDTAIDLAQKGNPYKIAGRCSVFCKSDCTHALNKGEPIENIVSGLCAMMVTKIDELIANFSCRRIMVIGGGVQNTAMLDLLRQSYDEVVVPDLAATFEAYGAALWAIDHPCIELSSAQTGKMYDRNAFISFHQPLAHAKSQVDFKSLTIDKLVPGDVAILGLDVGSTTTKAVLIREADKHILAHEYLRTNGDPVTASKQCYRSILKQIDSQELTIVGLGVTGSGRQIAGLHALTKNVINEIIAHANAASFFDEETDTLFEIGGQDAKYTYLTAGVPSEYTMNEACSAGTGSFLEESAFETLGIKTEEISELALNASFPPNFSDQCAAFIASDIKRAIQHGIKKNDILAGLVYSICTNYLNRVKGSYPIGKKIFMQGGVCYNKAVPMAMASLLKAKITVPPYPGLMGAFGVALEVAKRLELELIPRTSIDLSELAKRTTERKGSFICKGGKENCDRKCVISRLHIKDKVYPFGGMCDRYYNQRIEKNVANIQSLDLISLRHKLMFDVYGPDEPSINRKPEYQPITVGFNKSLIMHTLYPLFSNFFSRLGFKVVLADSSDTEGIARTETSFCLPVELAYGSFSRLLAERCDYLFIPQVMQIPVSNVPTYSRLCPFVQGEPYYLKAAFRREIKESGTFVLNPILKMGDGYEKAISQFVAIARTMGINEKNARNSFIYACEKQIAFEKELQRQGKKALYALEKDPNQIAIILFGRPYNAFSKDTNMGIPQKVASRNISIIPHDMLSADEFQVDKKMFWAMGQKIMKACQFVKQHPQLFGFYITNFSCGPDSFLLSYFRDVMGKKPSLTLELDQHTADAGIDTRIEAAIDIINRYRMIQGKLRENSKPYQPARVNFPYVYSSTGEKLSVTDSRVEVLLPSFGQKVSQAAAAILRKVGIHAKALPIPDKDGFLIGRKNTSGKECLPYILNTGSFIKHLENKNDPKKISVFAMATGGGPCRLGQYYRAFEHHLDKNRIKNAAMLTITDENGYGGLGTKILLDAWKGIILTDVLEDISSMLRVASVDPQQAMEVINAAWKKCLSYFEGKLSIRFSSMLKFMSLQIAKIPLKVNPAEVPVISLIGEIFVRRDEFSRKNIVDYLEKNGFMVRIAPLAEYICYSYYVVNNGLGERKFNLQNQLKIKFLAHIQKWWEKRIKLILADSGVYHPEMIDVDKTIEGVKHLVNENFRGECILTVGLGMREILEDSCGIISIGPFGCMYSRMAEAILKKEMNTEGKERMPGWHHKSRQLKNMNTFPFLAIESDGNPFPQIVEANLESFVLQAKRLHKKIMDLKGRGITNQFEPISDVVIKK